jgi:hypothetical protein
MNVFSYIWGKVRVLYGDAVGENVASPTSTTILGRLKTISDSIVSLSAKFNSLGQKTMANSAPVVLSSDQSAVPVTQSGTWSVDAIQSGTWNVGLSTGSNVIGAVTQSGTWNINNISGTISLPTGAATAANQTTANSSLSSIDTKVPSQGQATMSASLPVVLASNQTAIPVTQSAGPWTQNLTQVGGSSVTLGQKTSANSIPVVLPSDAPGLSSFRSYVRPAGTALIYKYGAITLGSTTETNITNATTVPSGEPAQAIDYTVTTAKTFYLTDVIITCSGRVNNAIFTARFSFGGTKSLNITAAQDSLCQNSEHFTVPIEVAATTVITVSILSSSSTSNTFRVLFMGYEV